MMRSAEAILLQIQSEQQAHDLLAHRDILHLDTQTRLKHMTLHFLKYAGKIATARTQKDADTLANILVDVFIICLATANALNVSLGVGTPVTAPNLDILAQKIADLVPGGDPYDKALTDLVMIAGRMAKSIESTDHLERGNPRAELEELIVELTMAMVASIGSLKITLQSAVEGRWRFVEQKSIFSRQISQ
jgi:hypothetical protein